MRNYFWPVLAGIAFGALAALLIRGAAPGWLADGSVPSEARFDRRAAPVSYAEAVSRAAPAVVNIYSERRVEVEVRSPLCQQPFFADRCEQQARALSRNQLSLGSGVVVGYDGIILTNDHIIENAFEISVALRDGRQGTATLVGTDPDTDLAVLRVEMDALDPIAVADSDAVLIGDVVLAIGNPFNLGQTVSQGIVSATGRFGLGLAPYEDLLQTDAAINPGNSGGALVNARGELIGINSLIYSNTGNSAGIGLAIPANMAMQVMREIVENGRVIRGWLGVEVQELSEAFAGSLGVSSDAGLLVVGVSPGGPAARAGLMPGDLLLSIEDQPATDSRAVQKLVAQSNPGDLLDIGIQRMGNSMTLEAIAGSRPTG